MQPKTNQFLIITYFLAVCSKCDKLQIGACSIHCALQWIKESLNVVISEGLTKARATIPKNMELKSSSIPGKSLLLVLSLLAYMH